MGGNCIYLWMSDYHPDGGQLFFPRNALGADSDQADQSVLNKGSEFPMFACLGKNTFGDDIRSLHLKTHQN